MIKLALFRLIRRIPELLRKLESRVLGLLDGIAEARAMAHNFKVLSHMSDAELARRGIKRQEIPQAVLTGSTRS